MRNKGLFLLLIFFFGMGIAAAAQNKIKSKDLTPKYRIWLEEEVVYIISSKEKDIFLQLSSDKERDIFINAFWKARDPNLVTPENEFKDEHYERLAYANKFLGRGVPSPGWRTDQGRMYIILGEPQQVDKYENESQIIPTEVWFYQGKMGHGLPGSFNLVFIQKDGFPNWELYSPVRDGPQIFLRFQNQDRLDYESIYRQIFRVQPALAKLSITLLPDDRHSSYQPSIASDILISRIFEAPKKVHDEYADKLLRYKDIIEVEYTANYIGNESLIQVLQDKSGKFFVHYLIEPSRFSLELYEGIYHTTLEMSGQIKDAQNRSIYQFDKNLSLRFEPDQFEQIKSRHFSYQDAFPMIEGSYTFHFLLKNRASKEFTSFEKQIAVPSSEKLMMSPLLLANSRRESPYIQEIKAFKFGADQYYASPQRSFTQNDDLIILFDIYGLSAELKNSGRLRFALQREGSEVWRRDVPLKDYSTARQITRTLSLKDKSPANYKIRVAVLNTSGEELVYEQGFFYISHKPALPRPFVNTELLAPADNPVYDYILGGQYFNSGSLPQARTFMERAYRRVPNNIRYALGFSQILSAEQDYRQIISILTPFVSEENIEHSCFFLLGKSYQALGDYPSAIQSYKAYLDHYGTNLKVLNDIGECHLKSGDEEEALLTWKKSLELDPQQKNIQVKVKDLEGIK